MAEHVITVRFTRENIAEATIAIPEGFDPSTESVEAIVLSWFSEHKGELEFGYAGISFVITGVPEPDAEAPSRCDDTTQHQDSEPSGEDFPVTARFSVIRRGEPKPEGGNVLAYGHVLDVDIRGVLDAIPIEKLPGWGMGFLEERFKDDFDSGNELFRIGWHFGIIEGDYAEYAYDGIDDLAYEEYYDERVTREGKQWDYEKSREIAEMRSFYAD